MKIFFDGKKIRDQILGELKSKIDKIEHQPGMAVICVGENPVCFKYVGLKQKFADRIGIRFQSFNFSSDNSEQEIINKIEELNNDPDIDGIMIQIPMPDKFDRNKLISAISQDKDVDGLRYCSGVDYKFKPPVVLAIMRAIEDSSIDMSKANTVIVGHGFLVGCPLEKEIQDKAATITVVDIDTKDLIPKVKAADLVISAVGKAEVIKPEMIKEGAVLIDAGTTEVGGELKGDIDPACYQKASFYTPVPGGIGPVTIAMLLTNLIDQTVSS